MTASGAATTVGGGGEEGTGDGADWVEDVDSNFDAVVFDESITAAPAEEPE